MEETDAEGNTPLHRATQKGRWITASGLIDDEIDINARNKANQAPRQAVLYSTNLPLAERLFQRGADPNTTYDTG
ncbi:MAG: ankyrin repeat protein [Verrucomicrobiales bacterium]|jgi:ankyrin repeat protein